MLRAQELYVIGQNQQGCRAWLKAFIDARSSSPPLGRHHVQAESVNTPANEKTVAASAASAAT